MLERGGSRAAPGQELFTVRETLHPSRRGSRTGLQDGGKCQVDRVSVAEKEKRQTGLSFRGDRILGQIENEADRKACRQVERSASPPEKVSMMTGALPETTRPCPSAPRP